MPDKTKQQHTAHVTDVLRDQKVADYIAYYTGKRTPCTHPMQHTRYGSDDPAMNGTTCVICGKRTDGHA